MSRQHPAPAPGGAPARDRTLPVAVPVLGAVALALLLLPLVALAVRTPWSRALSLLAGPTVLPALRLSLVSSLVSVALALLLGVPLALLFARARFPGKRLVRALALLPMVLPPVVGGAGLLAAFGRSGLVGRVLYEVAGISVPFGFAAVVLAATFVSMPFLVVTVEGGLRMLDRGFEDAAATLGASRWTVLRRVTLPMLAPSLAAGTALSWARALGEFGATITFAGNLPGRTQTMPLAVYVELQRDPGAAYLLGLVLLAVSVMVLFALRDRFLGAR